MERKPEPREVRTNNKIMAEGRSFDEEMEMEKAKDKEENPEIETVGEKGETGRLTGFLIYYAIHYESQGV